MPTKWIELYPKSFTTQLQQLNVICTTAKKKINKIFLSHWWSKPMLKAQINIIENQLLHLEESKKINCYPGLKTCKIN